MIDIKSPDEIAKIRAGGQRLAAIMEKLKTAAVSGITTKEIDDLAGQLARQQQAQPSFLGYNGFPANICISVNEEIVHGLPGEKKLHTGDIVGLDFGLLYQGFFTDMAVTVGIGQVDSVASKLMASTAESLQLGIKQIKPGNHIGDISAAVGRHAESGGYGIIRNLTGHGVGRKVHEPPQIPNFGNPGDGPELKVGMVLAIEPMLSLGDHTTELATDGWTFKMKDGSLSAHFEHTVVVTEEGHEILTKYQDGK
ncbi:type I methionyl aminopeptidase [Patescibacteria group bacterium]|nr:type I methionyl aminopeptidase [Patescibacteria group bacterium]